MNLYAMKEKCSLHAVRSGLLTGLFLVMVLAFAPVVAANAIEYIDAEVPGSATSDPVVSDTVASDTRVSDSDKKQTSYRVAPGIGIPYGVIGVNFEFYPSEYVGLLVGAGVNPAGSSTVFGGRLYLLPSAEKMRPRVTFVHGVVGVVVTQLVTSSGYTIAEEYTAITGNAFGFGVENKFGKRMSFDFDLMFPQYTVPAGATESGSGVKISFGVGWRY